MSNEDWVWIVFIAALFGFAAYCEYRERKIRKFIKDKPNAWISSDWGP